MCLCCVGLMLFLNYFYFTYGGMSFVYFRACAWMVFMWSPVVYSERVGCHLFSFVFFFEDLINSASWSWASGEGREAVQPPWKCYIPVHTRLLYKLIFSKFQDTCTLATGLAAIIGNYICVILLWLTNGNMNIYVLNLKHWLCPHLENCGRSQ